MVRCACRAGIPKGGEPLKIRRIRWAEDQRMCLMVVFHRLRKPGHEVRVRVERRTVAREESAEDVSKVACPVEVTRAVWEGMAEPGWPRDYYRAWRWDEEGWLCLDARDLSWRAGPWGGWWRKISFRLPWMPAGASAECRAAQDSVRDIMVARGFDETEVGEGQVLLWKTVKDSG